jgi:hypothetical protein
VRLRAVGSIDQMLAKAPEAVCEYCGFVAAILWRVDEGLVTPAAAYSKREVRRHRAREREGNTAVVAMP